jgi:hypothetical protein
MPLGPISFKEAARQYPGFTENSLRWLRFNGDENGFNRCLIKLGRRVLLIPPLFDRWLDAHRVGNAESWEAARAEEQERQLEQKVVRAAKKPKRPQVEV